MTKRIAVLVYNRKHSNMWNRATHLFAHMPSLFSGKLIYRTSNNIADTFRFLFKTLAYRPHIIFMVDIGLPSLITAVILKLLSLGRIKAVLDSGDVPHYMVKIEDYKHPFFIQKPFEWIVYATEHLSYKIADVITIRGHGYKDYLRKHCHTNELVFLPDGVPCEKFKPMNVSNLRKKYSLGDALVLGVMGHLFWNFRYKFSYGTYMIEAMAILKDLNIKAIILGEGIGRKYLEERIEELGLTDKIVFTGRVPYEELPQYLNLIDAYIFTCSPENLLHQIRTTNKLPELCATGTYMISTNWHEATLVLKENGIILPFHGFHDPDYPKALAQELKKIYKDRALLKKGLKGRDYALKEYDYAVLRKRLDKVFNDLMNPPKK